MRLPRGNFISTDELGIAAKIRNRVTEAAITLIARGVKEELAIGRA